MASVWPMTRCCFVACTMAQAMMWVNEIFSVRPAAASAALSDFRSASNRATASSRNEVAVGTPSDSVMFWTRRAAGPFRGSELGAAAVVVEGTDGADGAEGTCDLSVLSVDSVDSV